MSLKQMLKNRRGQVASLQPLTIAIVVIAITIVVGFQILASLKSSQTANSFAANATATVETAINDNLVDNLGLIILIAVFAVILALVGFFAVAARGRR